MHPGVRTIGDLSELAPGNDSREIFICGGAQIYEQALPLCSDFYLTRVKRVVDGDAFFPPFEHLFTRAEVLRDTPDFTIEHWRNARL